MVQRIPDDKLTQLGEDISRLHILDAASMRMYTDDQSITFIPKITYTAQHFKEVVEDVTAINKSDQYYFEHLGWGFGPDDLTEDQLKLEYALLLAMWERVNLTMTYGDRGWEYVIGDNPNYCPVYEPAKKLWDVLYGSETKDADDGETQIEEINGTVYVRKDGHEDKFMSWADALNAIVEKQGDGPTERTADDDIKTLHQLRCKAMGYDWDSVGIWRIVGEQPMLVFKPATMSKITGSDLELANQILKHGCGRGEFSNPVLNTVFAKVPCVLLKDPRNNLTRRVVAGMFIALTENSEMYIRHSCGQWKISWDTHTPEAYVNLCNIAEFC